MTHRYAFRIRAALIVAAAGFATNAAAQSGDALGARLDALEAQVVAAEDIGAIKRLQREYGYYVLPLLVGDRFVGRAEPVFDAKANTLRLLGSWGDTSRIDEALADLAAWLGASIDR